MRPKSTMSVSLVALLIVASCGGDDDPASGEPTADETVADTADTTASTSESATSDGATPATTVEPADAETAGDEPPTDAEPIRIGISGPFESQSLNLPEVRDAAQAGVDAINDRGGVAGRDLELVACNDAMNPDEAAACGRDLAGDDSIVAVVGSTSVLGQAFVPELEAAGLPDVGAYPTTGLHLESDIVYPLQGGIFSAYAGDARLSIDEGFEKVAIAYNDLPTAALVLAGVESVYGPAGRSMVVELPVEVTIPDVSPAVQEILRGEPDAIILAFAQPMLSRMIQGFYQAGSTAPLIIGSGDLNQNEIRDLGSAADLIIGTSPLPPVTTEDPGPAIERFNAEIDQYGSGDLKRNAVALNAWAAVQLFAAAAEQAETIDRDGIRAAIESMATYSTEGLTPPIDFAATPEVRPRLFNPSVSPITIEGENYVFGGEFLDPYAG